MNRYEHVNAVLIIFKVNLDLIQKQAKTEKVYGKQGLSNPVWCIVYVTWQPAHKFDQLLCQHEQQLIEPKEDS
ncbi:hypothetical protein GCM10027577_06970 [Spirosoma fluminis]